jgi:DNA replication protein DnaC
MPASDDERAWYEAYARRINDVLMRVFPAAYAYATADDPDVMAWCDTQVRALNTGEPSERWALLITGPVGVGKTWQAYGAVRRICLRARVSHKAVSLPDLLDKIRPGGDDRFTYDDYADTGLLLIDDLGGDKATEWAEMTLFRLVNHRSDACLPTIFTTNLPVDADQPEWPAQPVPTLKTELSARVYSRLARSAKVDLEGPDRRMPPPGTSPFAPN